MFLSTNQCEGIGECIKICPTEAIRLINGKAFSCITCGACFKACPNNAIFQNKYRGYVVDRAKCNGCGVCEFTCPVNSIHIEHINKVDLEISVDKRDIDDIGRDKKSIDKENLEINEFKEEKAIVKGICARCGICTDVCPSNSRVDGFDLIEDKQINFLKSLNLAIPTPNRGKLAKNEVKRNCVDTNLEECILCGRCEFYCPTNAIDVKIDQERICSQCRICVDVCPADAIHKGIIDHDKCVLCLSCLKTCPNHAIFEEDFKVNINIKIDQKITGSIISCLNCGLCADNSIGESLKQIDGKMRYDPSSDEDEEKIIVNHELAINSCPVSTLNLTDDLNVGLEGYCVSCGNCVRVCDRYEARSFKTVKWDGKVSDDCISCGICSEICPKDAITLKRRSIEVNLDKCIFCETCGIHCPTNAIPKTTMVKKSIADGFNLIDNKLCIKCKLCYNICPEEAIIDRDDIGIMVVDEDKCTYCGACKNTCPSKAFIFERQFENSL
ncbi:MAG: 4Fe-4S binding protein [Methanobacteriaceae archaeon]|jgi:energy-converting hydrogenase B subunit K|nr:4Fe-4S binding protein [Candidatus Methanorudis spinitermitis]